MNNATDRYLEKIKPAGYFFAILAACLAFALVIIVLVLGVKIRHQGVQIADMQKQLTQAGTDAAQAQSELAKAKTASTAMQAELDKAKDQQAQLQSQLEVSKIASAQVQTQADKAKGVSTELQSQVDSGKAESVALRTQLDQATAGATQLITQLNQAKIQSLDLQARLQKAEGDIAALQPLLLKTGHMPITTSLGKAADGRSFTLHLTNLYPQPVSVDIAITGADKTRSRHSIIGGSATQDIDKLAAGDVVSITSEGYDPLKLTVH